RRAADVNAFELEAFEHELLRVGRTSACGVADPPRIAVRRSKGLPRAARLRRGWRGGWSASGRPRGGGPRCGRWQTAGGSRDAVALLLRSEHGIQLSER